MKAILLLVLITVPTASITGQINYENQVGWLLVEKNGKFHPLAVSDDYVARGLADCMEFKIPVKVDGDYLTLNNKPFLFVKSFIIAPKSVHK